MLERFFTREYQHIKPNGTRESFSLTLKVKDEDSKSLDRLFSEGLAKLPLNRIDKTRFKQTVSEPIKPAAPASPPLAPTASEDKQAGPTVQPTAEAAPATPEKAG